MAHHFLTTELDALVQLLLDKGFAGANAEMVYKDSGSYTKARLELSYKTTHSGSWKFLTVRDFEVDPDGENYLDSSAFIELGRAKIAEVPSAHDMKVKDLVNQLETVKELAADLGIDTEIANPLVAIMERLASNALPAPKK